MKLEMDRLAKILRRCFAPLLAAALSLGASTAATIYVDASNLVPGNGTLASPYRKIQDAICHSAAGDNIIVNPGTYNESLRMRPGVSVVSGAGYAVTTIDGTGKACIRGESDPPNPANDYCIPQPFSLQCSTVVFGADFTNADRLDGFTITGGKGINRGSQTPPKIAGGGVFSFSAPTISNNLITGNILQGPRTYYTGGGLYMIAGVPSVPVITKNTIDGNRAVPISGIATAYTYGIGAGIYIGPGAYPVISQNVVTNNVAGQVTNTHTVGDGAGISVFTLGNGPDVVITKNLIAGNNARDFGGGVYIGGYILATHPSVLVTENEIRSNIAGLGGGVSTFYSKATIANNTFQSNLAFQGGALFVDQGTPTDTVIVTNNLITSNNADDLVKGGGGLYQDTTTPLTPLTIRYNDFYNNTPSGLQLGGIRTDATTIGFDRNINTNPSYKSVASNDYHLSKGSPALDQGNNPDASSMTTDVDGLPRIMDSDNDGTAFVDLGQFEMQSAIYDGDNDGTPDLTDRCPLDPLNDQDGDGICAGNAFNPPKTGKNDNCPINSNTNQANTDGDAFGNSCDPCAQDPLNDQDNDGVCVGTGFRAPKTDDQDNCPRIPNTTQTDTDGDGLGNSCDNCSGVSNLSQADLDADGTGDACDTDDDNDGVLDGADCAPLSPSVHGAPTAPIGFSLKWTSLTVLTWQRVPLSQGNTFNVYRGTIPNNGMHGTFNHTCFEEDSPDTATTATASPAAGTSYYFLVSNRNRCGESNLGTQSSGSPRPMGTPCTLVIRDTDADGLADVDDNCAANSNRFQDDRDADGIGNECETDDDNDGVDDALDCAPFDPTAFGVPIEIAGLVVTKTPTTQVNWGTLVAGSGTRYDVASGKVSDLKGVPKFGPGTCLMNNATAPPYTDARPRPTAGDSYYYMVRVQNGCGTGTYGSILADTTFGTSGGSPCP